MEGLLSTGPTLSSCSFDEEILPAMLGTIQSLGGLKCVDLARNWN